VREIVAVFRQKAMEEQEKSGRENDKHLMTIERLHGEIDVLKDKIQALAAGGNMHGSGSDDGGNLTDASGKPLSYGDLTDRVKTLEAEKEELESDVQAMKESRALLLDQVEEKEQEIEFLRANSAMMDRVIAQPVQKVFFGQ